MKEAKKGRCKKCKTYFYIHEHHILPKGRFGKGKTIKLCPNCHTHFHEYSKKNTTDENDAKQAKKNWNVWYKTVSVIVSVVAIVFIIAKIHN